VVEIGSWLQPATDTTLSMDRLADPDQRRRSEEHAAQGLVELAMWPRQKRRRNLPAVWGGGTPNPPQLLLNPVNPSDLQIVEALRSGRQGLGHAED